MKLVLFCKCWSAVYNGAASALALCRDEYAYLKAYDFLLNVLPGSVMGLASKSMLHLTCYAKLKIVSDMQHSVYLFDEDTGQHSAYLRLSFSPVASF